MATVTASIPMFLVSMNGLLLEGGVECQPECRATAPRCFKNDHQGSIRWLTRRMQNMPHTACGPSTDFRNAPHPVTGMSKRRMFRCVTSSTHASTSSTHVKASSLSMSCMNEPHRIPTFHRREVSQLRFVRGPTAPATEYTPSGIFEASVIHHDISHRVRSSTHVGRQHPLMRLCGERPSVRLCWGVIFGIATWLERQTRSFCCRNLLRFTFPADLMWRCNSALNAETRKFPRKRRAN